MRRTYSVALGALGLLAAAAVGCTTRPPADTDDAGGIDAPFVIEIDAHVDAPMPPDCPAGEVDCGSGCTRLAADSMNCGECGNACPSGSTCAVGRCDCYAPMLACDGLCTDPTTDPENCGECGNACAATETCSAGECIVSCTEADHAVCVTRDGSGATTQVCASLLDDPSHCGACNTRCAPGSTCVDGRCACPGGQLSCGGACVDVTSDPMHCGDCLTTCGEGGTCAGSRCTACGGGLSLCGTPGRCFDTDTSRLHCGACGRTCGAGEACADGLCQCFAGLVDCGTGCTDQMTDEQNCGGCGIDCGAGGVCTDGACTCASGFTMCGPECADLMRSEEHCGDCDTTCDPGFACQLGVCVLADSFRVLSFGTTGCTTVDHVGPSGDDRGGIAISPTHLFVGGDSSTVRMSAADLTGVTALGTIHDALIGDLESETVYVLLTATGTEPTGFSLTGTTTVTQLGVIDGATGALTATRIPLSTPIPIADDTGVFSGYAEALLGVPGASRLEWWHIELPTGTVTRLGDTQNATHRSCENWGWYGIAERFDDVHYATYAASSTQIHRLAIPMTGMTTTPAATVATFSNLSDMCSITFSTSRNRWYFHHEGSSQFTSAGGETAGYCDGTFDRP